MLKVVIAVVLLAPGIGHSMWLLQVFKVATVNPAWQGDSWILTGPAGTWPMPPCWRSSRRRKPARCAR